MSLVKIELTRHALLKGINKVLLITCIVIDGPVKFYKKKKSSRAVLQQLWFAWSSVQW